MFNPPALSASFLSLNWRRYFLLSKVTTATMTRAMTETPAKTPRPMGFEKEVKQDQNGRRVCRKRFGKDGPTRT